MPTPLRRIVGAVVGGAIGLALTHLLLQWGVFLLAAVGGGIAIGAGSRSVPRSIPWTLGITAVALAAGIVTAWAYTPFVADPSFGYFVRNLGATDAQTKIGLLLTAVIGLLYGGGSGPRAPRRPAEREDPLAGDGARPWPEDDPDRTGRG
jgi:hypothetical protein